MWLLGTLTRRLARASGRVAVAAVLGYMAATPWRTAWAEPAPHAQDRARPWSQQPFQYIALDQDIRDVLRELSAAVSVPVEMSDAVRGQARGRWDGPDAGHFLSRFAQDYGLDWYFDGSLLAVSAVSETATRVLPLHGVAMEPLRAGMASAGLLDSRFGLRAGPSPDTALVSGPPRFVSVVQQSIDAEQPAHETVRVAPAERVTIFHGSQRPVVVTF